MVLDREDWAVLQRDAGVGAVEEGDVGLHDGGGEAVAKVCFRRCSTFRFYPCRGVPSTPDWDIATGWMSRILGTTLELCHTV